MKQEGNRKKMEENLLQKIQQDLKQTYITKKIFTFYRNYEIGRRTRKTISYKS